MAARYISVLAIGDDAAAVPSGERYVSVLAIGDDTAPPISTARYVSALAIGDLPPPPPTDLLWTNVRDSIRGGPDTSYRFEETEKLTIFADRGPNGYYNIPPKYAQAGGIPSDLKTSAVILPIRTGGKAAEFGFAVPPHHPFTLKMWMKISAVPAADREIYTQGVGADRLVLAVTSAGNLEVRRNTTPLSGLTYLDFSVGRFHAISLVREDNLSFSLYANGVRIANNASQTSWDIYTLIPEMESYSDCLVTIGELAFWELYAATIEQMQLTSLALIQLPVDDAEPVLGSLPTNSSWNANYEFLMKLSVHFWGLDEPTGALWVDSWANIALVPVTLEAHLTITGSPARGVAHPYFGNRAVTLDGQGQYGSSTTTLPAQLGMTTSAWFRTKPTTNRTIYRTQTDANNSSELCVNSSGRLCATIRVDGVNYNMLGPAGNLYQDDQWHHIIYILSLGGVKKVYVDFEDVTGVWETDNTDFSSAQNESWVGGVNGTRLWFGSLSAIALINKALTASEVAEWEERVNFLVAPALPTTGVTLARSKGALACCDSITRPRFGVLSSSAQRGPMAELLADSPAALFKFDDFLTNLYYDHSGNGYHLAPFGNLVYRTRNVGGIKRWVLAWDRTTTYLTSSVLIPTDYPFTFVMTHSTANANSTGRNMMGFSELGTNTNHYRMSLGSNHRPFMSANDGVVFDNNTATVVGNDNVRHVYHAVFVSAEERRFYMDGNLAASGTVSIPFTPVDTLAFGANLSSVSINEYLSGISSYSAVYFSAIPAIRVAHHASAILNHHDLTARKNAALVPAFTDHGGRALSMDGVPGTSADMEKSLLSYLAAISPKAQTVIAGIKLGAVNYKQKIIDNHTGGGLGITLEFDEGP
jgi:hypothetical protein